MKDETSNCDEIANVSAVIPALVAEFQGMLRQIFSENLLFGFIAGGIAKGYADFDHDIDIIVVQKKKNEKQESEFREFFYNLHKKYGFKTEREPSIDISLGIAADEEKLNRVLKTLDTLKISPVLKTHDIFEAVVWGDMLSGQIIGEVGDIYYLEKIRALCGNYKDRWRNDIITNCISQSTYQVEQEQIESLDITRLFEYYVTYLKLKPEDVASCKKICILGTSAAVLEEEIFKRIPSQHKIYQIAIDNSLYEITWKGVIEKVSLGEIPSDFLTTIDTIVILGDFTDKQLFSLLSDIPAGKTIVSFTDGFLDIYSFEHNQRRQGVGKNYFDKIIYVKVASDVLVEDTLHSLRLYAAHFPADRKVRTDTYKALLGDLGWEPVSVTLYRSILHYALDFRGAISDLISSQENTQEVCRDVSEPDVLCQKIKFYKLSGIVAECNKLAARVVGHEFEFPGPNFILSCVASRQSTMRRLNYIYILLSSLGEKCPNLANLFYGGECPPLETTDSILEYFAHLGFISNGNDIFLDGAALESLPEHNVLALTARGIVRKGS